LSLKMFVLILGTMTVWTGIRAYRQYVAIREIERLDGYVATTRPRGPQWLRDWVGYKRYRFCEDVDFPRIDEPTAAVTEATLAYISWLPNLRVLGLWNTPTTDAGMVHLSRLSNLRGLFLGKTQVTDAGLAHLKGLTNLQHLELKLTIVTDDGVDELKQALPDLKVVH